ncbi:MAG: T9SS type A sorting domain-containing protein [Bacteroidetes bacterium]|nr:T9SS type A sorting domain-containing protein [Bacteroidota bacterium]
MGAPVDDKWEIVLFDFNGRIVFQESIPANQNRATIQFDQMSSGIYLLKIVEGKRYSTQTVIKE